MNISDLENKTTAALESLFIGFKTITWVLIVILIPLFAMTIYGLLTQENSSVHIALLVVAISCSIILPTQISNMRKIKTELNKRSGSE